LYALCGGEEYYLKFDKKSSWEGRAKKKQEGGSDRDDKFQVIAVLKNHFGLYGLTGEAFETADQEWVFPDIFVKSSEPQIAIELDGEVHGLGDEMTTTDKTFKRNGRYERLGIKLIILNKIQTDGYEDSCVIEVLKNQGLKPLDSI